MSVVLYYVIIFVIASTARLGVRVAFPICGVRPHYAVVHSVTLGVSGNSQYLLVSGPKTVTDHGTFGPTVWSEE